MDQEPPPPYVRDTSARQRELKEFSAAFEESGNVQGSLTLLFDASLSKTVPTLLEGSALEGNFRMNLARSEGIRSVVFGVDGEFLLCGVTGTVEKQFFFLRDEYSLWLTTNGEPHNGAANSTPRSNSTFKGSLRGEYTWPISVKLSNEAVVKKKDDMRTFTLPQTFGEHVINSTIRYRVWIKVIRRGLLARDKVLSMPFAYLRVTRPPLLPPLRQVAYQEGTPLLGPSTYPDGWYTEGPVHIEGNISMTVPFSVQATLYLAHPLAYTSGSVIPLCLRIESENVQALDLLSVPKAIHVRVRRHTIDYRESDVHLHYSQRAVWWTSDEQPASERVRIMNGEIHLKPGMPPNSELASFKLRYSVMMYNFEAVALHFEEKKFLQEVPIEICTFFGPGPHPKATTLPNTEPDVRHGKLIAPHTNAVSNEFY